MPPTGYLLVHTLGSLGICQTVSSAFLERWAAVGQGVRSFEINHLGKVEDWEKKCLALLAFAGNKDLSGAVAKLKCPVINYSHRFEANASLYNLFVDEAEIGRLAADHLLARGHSEFLFLHLSGFTFSMERGRAFQERIAAAGHRVRWLNVSNEWPKGPLAYHTAYDEALLELLSDSHMAPGVFCTNDETAADFRRRLGKLMPDRCDLFGIVGVDNLAGLQPGNPLYSGLTSVEPPFALLGERAADLFAAFLAGQLDFARGTLEIIAGARVIERSSTMGKAVGDPFINRLLSDIHRALEKNVSLRAEEVAPSLGIPARTLRDRFSKATGTSLRDYLLHLRLRRAARLLRETDRPITEIALDCGFNKPGALSTHFQKHHGCSPRNYRSRS
ncbi:MAG: helix-turn-helix domain-containing protein [Opitutales bacterium]|nr:helix-turn-helix domain-containing protein [Opitutales bacterium]